MTRRICSGCGHTIVQPTGAVGAVLGDHMDQHIAQHGQRGEASWWVVTTFETWPRLRAIAVLLAAVADAVSGLLARAGEAIARSGGGRVQALPVSQGEIPGLDIRDIL